MSRPLETFPQTIGQFEVKGRLGEGGMAVVYLATFLPTGRDVAIKLPHEREWARNDGRKRFCDEAKIGQLLAHPNACRIQFFNDPTKPGAVSDQPFIVLPLMRGGTLKDRLTRPMDPKVAATYALKLAEVLHYMHSQGIIHADLKPTNVLFSKPDDEEPILSDFGMSLNLTEAEATVPPPGQGDGTAAYTPPEHLRQLTGVPISGLFDVWALGVLLYEMLTNTHPFMESEVPASKRHRFFERAIRFFQPETITLKSLPPTRMQMMLQISEGKFKPVREVNSRVPAAIAEICETALRSRVHQRYSSAQELANELKKFIQPTGSQNTSRPVVPIESISIDFVPHATIAPPDLRDTLYLDIGGDVRAGVIDHHQLYHYPGSNTTMVMHRLKWIDQCVIPSRKRYDPFKIFLHHHPDLDALVCAYLARYYLAYKQLPRCVPVLCDYLDRVDTGHPGFTVHEPHTLYAGFMALLARAHAMTELDLPTRWRWAVQQGFLMLDDVIERDPKNIDEIFGLDVFDNRAVFTKEDRQYVDGDRARYQAKLADPECHVRRATLVLPRQSEGRRTDVPAMLARYVQELHDPERCMFFKDWARTDNLRTAPKIGFGALCVFMDLRKSWAGRDCTVPLGRAILSVAPIAGVALRGLGKELEEAEQAERTRLLGHDDRDFDVTGRPRTPLPGYLSPDPWYDGRAHHFTIVDAPACGSVLPVERIEQIFLEYGKYTMLYPI